MPEPHEIVAEINSLLDSREQVSPRRLTDLAGTYAHMCSQANIRLRQCARYLRKSLLSEALYHAQIEPDLLDIAAGLDLPRIQQWNALCKSNSVEIAPLLLMDIAAEINQAYARQAPVQPLLVQLRLLSLGRARLRRRLNVMRQISAMVPDNAQMELDIKDFEAARVAEIKTAAKKAFKAGDIDTLRELSEEIAGDKWLSPFPPATARNILQNARQLQIDAALKKLNEMIPKLHASHGAMAYDECESLLEEWNNIVQADDLQIPDKLQRQVQPIVDWAAEIAQQRLTVRQFDTACLALVTAMDEKTRADNLRKLYHNAKFFDQPLDHELESRYQATIAEIELTKRRRTKVYFFAASILGIISAAIVSFLIYHHISTGQVRDYCLQLETAIEAGQANRAEQIWSSMEDKTPELADHPDLVEMRVKIDKALADKKDRAGKFDLYMAQALKVSKGSLGSTELQNLVGKTKQFADTSEQKLAILNLQMQIDDFNAKKQEKIDAAFMGQVRQLTEMLKKLDQKLLDRGQFDRFDEQIGRIERKIRPLKLDSRVSPEAMRSLDVIIKETDSLKQAAFQVKEIARKKREIEQLKQRKQLQIAKAIENLALCVNSAPRLGLALKDFAEKYPESKKSPQFKQAAERASAWLILQQWQEIVDRWGGRFKLTEASDIDKRIKIVNTYLTKHPSIPIAEQIKSYLEYLTKAKSVVGEQSPLQERLRDVMTSEIFQLYSFTLAGDKRYYLPKGEKFSGTKELFLVKVVLTPDTSKLTSMRLKAVKGKSIVFEKSPQAKLAPVILANLEFEVSDWDTFGFDVMKLIMDDEHIDPVLKAELLQIVLKYVKGYSWGGEKVVADILKKLKNLNLGDIWWMNPDNEKANMIKPQVRKIIAKIPTTKTLKNIVRNKQVQLFESLAMNIKGYGLAIREDDKWNILTDKQLLKTSCTLWIVADATGTDTGKLQLKQVGSAGKSKVSLDAGLLNSVPEGTMVFIRNAR